MKRLLSKHTLVIVTLVLMNQWQTFGQSRSFCSISDQINSATNIDEIKQYLSNYLIGVLGYSPNGINSVVADGAPLFLEYESPFGGYDASGIRQKIINKVYYKDTFIGSNWLPRENILEARLYAKKTIEFFSDICEIKYEDNPNIKFFKVFNKLLKLSQESGIGGPYGFIIEICMVYVDVSIKAIEFIDGWLTSKLSDSYFNTNGGEIVFRIFIEKLKKLENFNRVTSYSIVSNNPNFVPVELESYYDSYSNYGKCITVTIPGQTMTGNDDYALKLKIGGTTNIVYIPINTKVPFRKEGYNNYLVKLKKVSGDKPENTILTLK